MPIDLQKERVDTIVCRHLGLKTKPADMRDWKQMLRRLIAPRHNCRIAVVGKYIGLQDAYKSLYEALKHAGGANNTAVEIVRVDAEFIERDGAAKHLSNMDGILVPGGFGNRGIEGKIAAARYAREKKIPYFGICLGMQIAVIEFARHVCKLKDANSAEFDAQTLHPVICLIDEQQRIVNKGGTMRLGAKPCQLKPGTHSRRLYRTDLITERHRHRYEFNNSYRDQLTRAGLKIAGLYTEKNLVELIEVPAHPYFVACQFHPEFKSRPHTAHPLFRGFISAALQRAKS